MKMPLTKLTPDLVDKFFAEFGVEILAAAAQSKPTAPEAMNFFELYRRCVGLKHYIDTQNRVLAHGEVFGFDPFTVLAATFEVGYRLGQFICAQPDHRIQ